MSGGGGGVEEESLLEFLRDLERKELKKSGMMFDGFDVTRLNAWPEGAQGEESGGSMMNGMMKDYFILVNWVIYDSVLRMMGKV